MFRTPGRNMPRESSFLEPTQHITSQRRHGKVWPGIAWRTSCTREQQHQSLLPRTGYPALRLPAGLLYSLYGSNARPLSFDLKIPMTCFPFFLGTQANHIFSNHPIALSCPKVILNTWNANFASSVPSPKTTRLSRNEQTQITKIRLNKQPRQVGLRTKP